MAKQNGHFELPKRNIRLKFEDGSAWDGAEVVCIGKVPAELVLSFMGFQGRDVSDLTGAETEMLTGLLRQFGDHYLVEWNVTDGGEPIPSTADGMLQHLDMEECLALVAAWMNGIKEAATVPLAETDSSSSTVSLNGGAKRPAKSSTKMAG